LEAIHPKNEQERIQALHALQILDTPPEDKFDRITRIAQILFDVPIALVSLVDTNRQWFKSCAGLSATETPRSMSFCAHAILNQDVLVIEDATKDERFFDNPLVTGEPFIKFYAGKPIRNMDNQMLGTLCIIDKNPRQLSRSDKTVLTDLAKWVEKEFQTITLTNQLQEKTSKLLIVEQELRDQNKILENEIKIQTEKLIANEKMSALGIMSSRLAHDLKNPLTVIKTYSDILSTKLESNMVHLCFMASSVLKKSIRHLERIIDDTLNFVRTTKINSSKNSINDILKNSIESMDLPDTVTLLLPENDVQINCDGEKLKAVFSNLITNALQAIDNSGKIIIRTKNESSKILIEIEDSGAGIPAEILPKIFDPLFTSKPTGTGLGLGICKSIIEQHQGTISVRNNPTTFTITLQKS
jgi:signal transduction histidine kinase